ncbi:MAG: UPF0175 family protein, partial [Fretibacterium sp.]|nr:UPF0175 family protein [Fretibacterium sp.]
MDLATVQISVPKDMVSLIETSDMSEAMKRNAMMLYPRIKDLTISHGRAAEILGVNKIDLIEFYGSMGIPYINQTPEEIEEELRAYHEQ